VEIIPLNGVWQFKGRDSQDWLLATVPGCVHTDLLAADQIPDPFYRDNELGVQWIGETEWIYRRTFDLPPEFSRHERILLRCKGLDTLVAVSVNGVQVGRTDNQFRSYEFDVRTILTSGQNEITCTFESALKYGQARLKERDIYSMGDDHRLPGGNYVRKSQCNFGWDWGPKLVTCGIWKDIELVAFDTARIEDVHILQRHVDGQVRLLCDIATEALADVPLTAKVIVRLDGEKIGAGEIALENGEGQAELLVEEPRLWWPNGMGEHPLYQVEVQLYEGETLLDSATKTIGLRTLHLIREDDEWGESFRFECNGVPFFAKGANWIPADVFVSRLAAEHYKGLLQAAQAANMNMLRVWGGGIYEAEVFYDLCDQLGICVWQDFMFACAIYPTDEEAFMDNVEAEARHQVRRLRHHASLALWCGNNELEQGLVAEQWTDHTMSWADYSLLFDQRLAEIVAQLDPETDYWPGSPHSPYGDRADWNNPKWGDAHIWDVWHGMQPFEYYRTCLHRFVSEFGFQSFPGPRTISEFTIPSDLSINSPIMEHHQRSPDGNAKILHYLSEWFRLSTDFDYQVMLSQMLQGMAIKYAVEHWRRSMPRVMGALYWQLNDCWPVASWASLDYYRRWKALHYMARHFYAPLLVSGLGDLESGAVEIHVTNDQQSAFDATLDWTLMTADEGEIVSDGMISKNVPALGDSVVDTLDLREELKRYGEANLLLTLRLSAEGGELSRNLVLLSRPKHLKLGPPALDLKAESVADGRVRLTISAQKPALWVWMGCGEDAPLSDNFFHVFPGQPVFVELETSLSPEQLLKKTKLFSLWDTFQP